MPYPSEHSARLKNPDSLKSIRVRRTRGSGDGAVQGVKIPETIDVIWYIIKSDKKEVPIAQALRFSIKKWSADKAEKWLKDNKINYLIFEKASIKNNNDDDKQKLSEKFYGVLTNLGSIQLQEKAPDDDKDKDKPKSKTAWIQMLETIDNLVRPFGQPLKVTKSDLKELKKNFDNGLRGKEVPIDYWHNGANIAAGWIEKVEIRNNGNDFWGLVRFTPNAAKMIEDEEVKYFSIEYNINYIDSNSGKVYKNVLFGGGLTNRPNFKGLSPIKLSENFIVGYHYKHKEGGKIMDEKDIIRLSEDNADLKVKLSEIETEKTQLKADLETVKAEKVTLSEKVEGIEKEKAHIAFESEFKVLLDEGKLTPGQKETLTKKFTAEELKEYGKTLTKIVKLDEGAGSSGGGNSDKVTLTEAEQAVQKEYGYKSEDIINNRTL